MFDVISPFINLLWPILLGAAGVIWFFINGARKKREGIAEGRAQEQARSEKRVKEVEAEMKAEVQKPRTTKETKRRLQRGDF